MRRIAMTFLLAISLAGAIALWPDQRHLERAENIAHPLALELVALSAAPDRLLERVRDDPLLEMVVVWDETGQLIPPVRPDTPRYPLTTERLRALEALLSARSMPVWSPAPQAGSDAVVRCQRAPDVCIVFAVTPLAEVLDFPPERLLRPLQGEYALGPALLLVFLAVASAIALFVRQMQRQRRGLR